MRHKPYGSPTILVLLPFLIIGWVLKSVVEAFSAPRQRRGRSRVYRGHR